jgi:hypothetical protein
MESSGMFSARVITSIAISLVPALIASIVLGVIARDRKSAVPIVAGWIAAAALAPAIAGFFAVRHVIRTLSGMATSGGGIGAVSAGVWEATQPLLFASYLACLLMFVTMVIAFRAAADGEFSDDGDGGGAMYGGISFVALAGFAAIALIYLNVSGIIINVLDPHAPPMTEGIATISNMIAHRLMTVAVLSCATTLLLLVSILITAVRDRESLPSASAARGLVFASLLGFVLSIASVFAFRALTARLYTAALTGSFH